VQPAVCMVCKEALPLVFFQALFMSSLWGACADCLTAEFLHCNICDVYKFKSNKIHGVDRTGCPGHEWKVHTHTHTHT
jgi:hypothetical protein